MSQIVDPSASHSGSYASQCSSRALAPAPVLIYSIDQHARIADVSDQWLVRFGRSCAEVIGRSPSDFMDAASAARVKADLEQLQSGGTCRDLPYRFLDRDGVAIDVLLSAGVQLGPDGQPVQTQVVLTEVVAEHLPVGAGEQREAPAKANNGAASEAAGSKVHLLQTLSHELRTPIHGILGAAQLLNEHEPRPDQVSLLDALGASAKHLLRLVDDVLDLSRIEAGHLQVASETVELDSLVRELLQIHGAAADAKGIDLRYAPDPHLPPCVLSDGTRLRQVLHNLLSNGIKYTFQGSVILALRRSGQGLLRFEVRDTGPGIAPDYRRRVFEAFDRGEADTARSEGGTGLGLPIARRIAEALGGRLSLEDGAGPGACFAFEIPLVESTRLPAASSGVQGRLDDVHLLLVEDNPVNAMIAMRMVQAVGARVTHVVAGAEAVDQVQRQRFDAVLMDLSLTDMQGDQAVCLIRALPGEPSTLPILAFSADTDPAAEARALAAGMDGFLSKPIELERLRSAVLAAIQAHR